MYHILVYVHLFKREWSMSESSQARNTDAHALPQEATVRGRMVDSDGNKESFQVTENCKEVID